LKYVVLQLTVVVLKIDRSVTRRLARCLDRLAGLGLLATLLHYEEIWVVPAILGSVGVLIVAVDLAKMAYGALSTPGPKI